MPPAVLTCTGLVHGICQGENLFIFQSSNYFSLLSDQGLNCFITRQIVQFCDSDTGSSLAANQEISFCISPEDQPACMTCVDTLSFSNLITYPPLATTDLFLNTCLIVKHFSQISHLIPIPNKNLIFHIDNSKKPPLA